jgi:exodeoxyribonuclease V alpha subunit
MLDVHLARAVLTALPPTARVVLVGDPHQLPSVGCGLVLQDVIESCVIPVARLTTIKRQNPGALVLALHSILHGRVPDIANAPTDDLQFVARETPEEIRETVLGLATRQLPGALPRILERAPEDCDGLRDIQVITPTRERGELSCAVLNAAMQAHYAPAVDGPGGKARLRVGDKVIQCRNDYELGLVNGDVGFVRGLDDEVADNGRKRKVMRCSFVPLSPGEPEREAKIPAAENDLVLAYAVTCHKYQGSEAPIIVIPIHGSMPSVLLTRNWIYTAMSRAARLCVVVGSWGAFRAAVRRVAPTQRKTGLREMLAVAAQRQK